MITGIAPVVLIAGMRRHVASAAVVALRYLSRGRGVLAENGDLAVVSLIQPDRGLTAFERKTLMSSFAQDYPRYEILFCAHSERDPAVPGAREVIAQHPDVNARLPIGADRIRQNPNLNTHCKGSQASRADWIAMTDGNLLLTPDYLSRLASEWRPGTGIVSARARRRAAGRIPGSGRMRVSQHVRRPMGARRDDALGPDRDLGPPWLCLAWQRGRPEHRPRTPDRKSWG